MSAALQGPSGRIPLETTPLMIGYTPDNRLVVNDAQITLITAIIAASGQNYTITAVNSAYAVTLNGQQLVLHIAHEMRAKDTIRIGEATFMYEESQPAPAPYTPVYPPYAEANPYGYEISNEAAIKAAPEIARNVQTDPVQPVAPVAPTVPAASSQELPVQKGPITPIPGSSSHWPQYPTTGNNWYVAPPPTFSPAQPFAQPAGGTMPPGMGASAPVAQGPQNRSNLLKWLLIALAVVIVLVAGGSGVLAYQLTRPQPIIALSSQYMQGNVPIGAANTSLHVRGYKFSSNAPITFLLDNQPITTGAANVTSDGSGSFQADLLITAAWLVGMHQLTAKDSGDYLTTNSGAVRIVNPGEAGTPGPNGIPANDSSFTLSLKITDANGTFNRVLTVKGNSSSDSATVCDAYSDSGQSITNYGSFQDGDVYKRTDTFACQGTYKAGKLSYTETINSESWNISDGASCQATTPITYVHIDGTLSNATTLSGTYSQTGYTANCTGGHTSTVNSSNEIGSWTGTIA